MDTVDAACPLCSAPRAVILSRRARDGSSLTTVLCEGCGLGRVHPLPQPGELANFYRARYRLEYKRTYEPKPHRVLRNARLAVRRISLLRQLLASGLRLLDVGCGSGEFVYILRASGVVATGIEPNLGYAAYCREYLQLPVEPALLEDYSLPSRYFDVITLFHVLEHLADPVSVLFHLASALRPAGVLVVEVPNLSSRSTRPANRFHRAHLFHFTVPTLRLTARRAGLRVLNASLSSDGGVIFALIAPDPSPDLSPQPAAGSAGDVLATESRLSALKYFLSPATLARTVRRLARHAEERLTASLYPSRRHIVESLSEKLRLSFPGGQAQ